MNDKRSGDSRDSGDGDAVERESMAFDVVIVGAGVAGLSAAIRLKQLAARQKRELSVVALDKGAQVGAHIVSGAVIDPSGLDALLPDWRERGAPLRTAVGAESLVGLTRSRAVKLPSAMVPPHLRHQGCYVGSLGELTVWLAAQAEALGVEIYPGFAADALLFGDGDEVVGVATPDQGVNKAGERTDAFAPGMALHGAYTLIAEGARGYLTEKLIYKFHLREGRDVGKYAIGLKELWRVSADRHQPGLVEHMVGWPLPSGVTGGGFVYHYGEDLVSLGLIIHLDYTDLSLSPYELAQRFKTHPTLQSLLAGGERIGFGARAMTAGGWQSTPRLTFPGGALLGCSAGLLDFARLKGVHNAMLSGAAAAESCFVALAAGRSHDELADYQAAIEQGPIATELKRGRNLKPYAERFGPKLGGAIGLLEQWGESLFGRTPPLTLTHKGRDRDRKSHGGPKLPVSRFRPDGVLTFEQADSVRLAAVRHDGDQPAHLQLVDPLRQLENVERFGFEPAEIYCPAHVYEIREDEAGKRRLHIDAGNCLHCKLCDLKDPADNIRWRVPAGGGPAYVGL